MPLTLEYLPVEDLPVDERNPKGHALEEIDASMTRFGYVDPVVIDERTGKLLSGHGRREALLARQGRGEPPPLNVEVDGEGRWLAPVVRGVRTTSDIEAGALIVGVNELVAAGGWDPDRLAPLLEEIRAQSTLAGTGFTNEGLDELLAGLALDRANEASDPDVDLDELPPRPPPTTALGDVWTLGTHRLVCGDAADAATVRLLLDGAKADMIWTDPPYGVAYVGKTAAKLTIANDDGVNHRGFLASVFSILTEHVVGGAPFYSAGPPGPLGTEMRLAISDVGWRFHQALVWVKDQFVLGHSDYHYMHEDVLYGWLPGGGRSGRGNHAGTRWEGDHAQTTVLQVPRPKRSEEHPTMKPVDLIVPMILNSSRPGLSVLDPFAGSGSTLIAAQRTARVAYCVEIAPEYCDTICARYQRMSGDKPVRAGESVDFLADR